MFEKFFQYLVSNSHKFTVMMVFTTLMISSFALVDLSDEKNNLSKLKIAKLADLKDPIKNFEKSEKIDFLLSKISTIENIFSTYSEELAEIKSNTVDKHSVASALTPAAYDFKILKEELKELKGLIVSNPETSLSIARMNQQIDFLQKSNSRIITDISTYTTIGMWLVGALITVSLGLFGLVITTMFKQRQ